MDWSKTLSLHGVSIGRRLVLLFVVGLAVTFPYGEALADSGGKEMAWGNMTMTLLGGLALFLFGMEQMADALKAVAGERMKGILATLTKTRISGAVTGALVTAVVQSSSVTTVLVVGFVTAGLMSFSQTLGIIFGANVGTTITAQIVAFKVTKVALLMVFVGFGMMFAGGKERIKQYGAMLMGLGLVFFGMSVMSGAMKPLRSYQPFLDLMVSMESPMIGILVAAAFTGLIQSSSATTGIVIVMASQGFVTLPAGIALAFGANIGTCVTALLASIGKPREAVRAALAHILFNTVGVVIWYFFIPVLAEFVIWFSPVAAEGITGMDKLAAETPRQIANAHTVFNVANTIIFLPLIPQFAALIERMLPDREGGAEDASAATGRPLYLNEILISTPTLALDAARREIKSLGLRVNLMLNDSMPTIINGDLKELKEVEKKDVAVDKMHANLLEYLGKISRTNLSPEQSKELMALINVADNLEGIGDTIETNLVYLGEQRLAKGVTISAGTVESINSFHEMVNHGLELALRAITEDDSDAIRRMKELDEQIEQRMADAAVHHVQRLTADEPSRVEAYSIEMGIMDKLRIIFGNSKSIVRQAEHMISMQNDMAYQKAVTN
ncbi:MAG: Na/Pi cotransporter family protein [Magnetococcales bacterium]|nr:Na/Pi cotransporter family protein [Magnetococcales bacterium]